MPTVSTVGALIALAFPAAALAAGPAGAVSPTAFSLQQTTAAPFQFQTGSADRAREGHAYSELRRLQAKVRRTARADGGVMTPEHRAALQAELDRLAYHLDLRFAAGA